MSAFDDFNSFNNSLSDKERESVKAFAQERRTDLLAARSEDARLRIVQQYIAEVHRRLRSKKLL